MCLYLYEEFWSLMTLLSKGSSRVGGFLQDDKSDMIWAGMPVQGI